MYIKYICQQPLMSRDNLNEIYATYGMEPTKLFGDHQFNTLGPYIVNAEDIFLCNSKESNWGGGFILINSRLTKMIVLIFVNATSNMQWLAI
jgi:hypothetical protein